MDVTLKGLVLLSTVCALAVSSFATANDLRVVNAAQNDDPGTVRSLLKQGADVNAPQADGATALEWASYNDDVQMAGLLIAAGAKINAANAYGIGALWLACANGSESMVDRLLRAGADVNLAQWSGATALMMCARTGNVEAVKSILARGARVNTAENTQGQTALMWAAAKSHPEVVKALVEDGADVNASTKGGTTPLMFSAQQGDIESARVLLAAAANINAVTNAQATWVGDTPLLLAAESGHEEMAIFLLDKGANPNAADEFGYTALHFTMISALATVAGVRMQDDTWQTFLFRPDMPRLVHALLAHRANPNARITKYGGGNKLLSIRKDDPSQDQVSEIGVTPFLVAAYANDVEIMRMLVSAGADPNIPTMLNTTPLMEAAGLTRLRVVNTGGCCALPLSKEQMTKSFEAVKLCVDLGADVNAANDMGLTALHGAAFQGRDEIVSYLVENGANINAKDITGQTPLDKAMGIRPKGTINYRPNGFAILTPSRSWPSTVALMLKLGATPSINAPASKQTSLKQPSAQSLQAKK